MPTLLLELQSFPPIPYFLAIKNTEKICLEKHEYFEKQTYRNRYHLLGSLKVEILSIPVIKANSKQLISDIKIDQDQAWQRQHLRTWEACYAKSLFYEFYVDEFKAVFNQKHELLADFNMAILSKCLKFLNIKKEISYTETYLKDYPADVYDFRSVIHPKKTIEKPQLIGPFVYSQNFGNAFVPNLSVLDLIFNQGPAAGILLKKPV